MITSQKFRTLKNPQTGMTLDAKTGTWSWKPAAWQVGRFDVEIVAEEGGKEVPVAKWVIEVE